MGNVDLLPAPTAKRPATPPSAPPLYPAALLQGNDAQVLRLQRVNEVANELRAAIERSEYAYSKFPEVVKMFTTSAKATVTILRDIFSRHGLPEIIVSDNGPQFTATEFEQFCTSNGILHRTSAVYKPSKNGQAERVVKILKSAIKQAHFTNSGYSFERNCVLRRWESETLK